MVAMQIAREPLVRHVLRQTFQERAKINIKPTKKGKKVGTFTTIVREVLVFYHHFINCCIFLYLLLFCLTIFFKERVLAE